MQAAYHQRMDVLSNMGFMCLFAFAACPKESESWDSKVHFYLGSQKCRIWEGCNTLTATDVTQGHLTQWGFCWGKAVGAWFHSMVGSAMQLLDIHASWFRLRSTMIGTRQKWSSGHGDFCIRISLRSRGSTHRSYWRAEGVMFFSTTRSVLQVATFQSVFYSVHVIFKSHSHNCRKPCIPKCGSGKPALPANVLLVSWL